MEKQSSSRFRIDEQVFLTMIFLGALSLFVLAFRYKSSETCQPVKIFIRDGELFEGSPVSFSAGTAGGKTYQWNFGDGTTSGRETLPTIVYTYKTAGTYTVMVTVNGKCEEWQKITVRTKALTINSSQQPLFSVPDSAYVRQTIQFEDHTADATSWEWRFGETEGVDDTTKSPRYMFDRPGPKTVYLKINGRNDRAGTRVIYIKDSPRQKEEEDLRQKNRNAIRVVRPPKLPDAPTTAPNVATEIPVVKKAPEISEAALKNLFMQVVEGQKSAADFSEYLCGNLNLNVIFNNKPMTFSEMCAYMRKVKKIKRIKQPVAVIAHKNEEGCIYSLNVVLEEKGGFLGIRL